MKKTLEYLYIFSKFSTSFILLICILFFGYFFYVSFKNQETSKNDQVELINKIDNNEEKISNLSKKIKITDNSLDVIKKTTENNINTNNIKEISLLNKKIKELSLKLENISLNLLEIQSQNSSQSKKIQANTSSSLLEKNKTELVKLIIFKFENDLEFIEELNILQNLIETNLIRDLEIKLL